MWWPILAFFMPIYVAWTEGSTYAFGASVIAVGVALIMIGIALQKAYLRKTIPHLQEARRIDPIEPLEDFAPRWMVFVVMTGMGFVPSGIVTIILLWFGVIENQG